MIGIGNFRFVFAGLGFATFASSQTLTVIQTASTNRTEIRVTVPRKASSMVKAAGGTSGIVQYSMHERERLWKTVSDASPLDTLPISHCIKSVSFGSSLFVELDGRRSQDLSCQHQGDSRTTLLRSEAQKLLQAAVAQHPKPKWKPD